jgi:hypothetical protein
MITITLQRAPDGWISRFRASGHAGYAESGHDIICAAVTALAATAIGSLQELAAIEPLHRLEDGLIEICLPDRLTLTERQEQTAAVLMQALLIGCRQIGDSYGDRFIRIRTGAKKGGNHP